MNNIIPFTRIRPVDDYRRDMLETLMLSMQPKELFMTIDSIIDIWAVEDED